MTDRVHSALDGEIRVEDLTPEERRMLVSMAATVEDVVHVLQQAPSPDLSARVMAALTTAEAPLNSPLERTSPRPAGGGLVSWLWNPRRLELAWRPAYAVAAILVLALSLVPALMLLDSRSGSQPVAAGPAEPVLYVQFRLEAPGASSVELAGSFTDWGESVPLMEGAPGMWSTLVALEPGVHDYVFVIDGRTWIADPTAPAVDDGFGGTNSRLFLTHPDRNV